MMRFSHLTATAALVTASVLLDPATALAGGKNPLTCSQGDDIRTIDYYMDINMEDLKRINEEPMDEAQRELLIDQNTEEFMALQERRDELIEGCALEIRARNEYWENGTPPPAAQPSPPSPLPSPPSPQAQGETTPVAPSAPTPTAQELPLETTGGVIQSAEPQGETSPAAGPLAAAGEAGAPSQQTIEGITLEIGGGTGAASGFEGESAPIAVPDEPPATQQGLSQPPAQPPAQAPAAQQPLSGQDAEQPAAAGAQPLISLEYTGETPSSGPLEVTPQGGESQ